MQACTGLLLDDLIVGHDNLLEFCLRSGAIVGFLRRQFEHYDTRTTKWPTATSLI